MRLLSTLAPEVHQEFEKGNHAISRLEQPFSQVWANMALEENHRYDNPHSTKGREREQRGVSSAPEVHINCGKTPILKQWAKYMSSPVKKTQMVRDKVRDGKVGAQTWVEVIDRWRLRPCQSESKRQSREIFCMLSTLQKPLEGSSSSLHIQASYFFSSLPCNELLFKTGLHAITAGCDTMSGLASIGKKKAPK
ncbi:hypothetical protein OS493_037754 [Desmophyllum pertusum]|uniref:Uncharacterized protein n=1 Tax=Desmophyllum pertusum TaxID=174260 RepID=A0A9W9ZV33_9CNID|nr:hypothetical protein OS493_037754 [Desmophyllum pertusum]